MVGPASEARAQRVRLPENTLTEVFYQPPTSGLAPIPQTAPSAGSSTTLGPPTFDPYSTNPNAAATPPSLSTTPGTTTSPYGSYPTPTYGQAPVSPSTIAPPTYSTPGTVPPGTTAAPAGVYPPGAYTQQPQVLFPNGLNVVPPQWNLPQPLPGPYLRLFQDCRITYTWLPDGNATNEMETQDIEVGTTMNFPNFLWCGQPLHVSPVFDLSLWDGPVTGPGPPPFPTELPSRVYGTYLEFGWEPRITPQLGADLDVSLGVFSDFDSTNQDSLRLQGTGLLVLGLTPTCTLKGGVTFLDRVDIGLLPAGGVLWQPNPRTKFDIYFPSPKLACYLTTMGNTEVWWYVNAEIGGGSWTVARPGAGDDTRMDINDWRAGGGVEWTSQTKCRGFVELAYVFNRELVFASGTPASQDLDDTYMVRAGLRY